MRIKIATVALYAHAYTRRAQQTVINAKDFAVQHKSEIKCIAATSVVVGLTARADGFKAGYEFAQSA